MTDFEQSNLFPYESAEDRLHDYTVNTQLLEGNHFDAFSIEAAEFSKEYKRLRYVVANFAGLVAKVSADTLFGEQFNYDAAGNQTFVESLFFENKLYTLLYESSLENAAIGDAVFRISATDNEIGIETLSPSLWFPHKPKRGTRVDTHEIAFKETVKTGSDTLHFLVREIHSPGIVETKVYELEAKSDKAWQMKIGNQIDIQQYNQFASREYEELVETGIDRPLIVHVPNFRYRTNKVYGDPDFLDIKPLQFALNNRLTKIDNILDKHSDPILAVPDGVLDEQGQVRKDAIGMFEKGDDGDTPEYIVWNANLEAAFEEVDHLMKFLFMQSEVSPDVLGFGVEGGQAESGRALKMRLLRTLAKRNRKRLYYDQGIKDVLITAQEFAKANGYNSGGVTSKEPEQLEIKWADGVVDDQVEQTDVITAQIEAGLMHPVEAIMILYNVDEQTARQRYAEIQKDQSNFTSFIDRSEGA